jgi:hypothetical protein
LTGLVASALLAGGVIAGQSTRWRALFALDDISWGSDAVTVSYRGGNTPVALVVLALVLAALAAGCLWARRFVPVRVAVGAWALALAGAAIGWGTTTADDGIQATRVADHLRDEGQDVDASITSGETSVVRPGGSGGITLTAPLTVAFTVDGSACTLVVDDALVGDAGSITLTPSCG